MRYYITKLAINIVHPTESPNKRNRHQRSIQKIQEARDPARVNFS